jgi:hypothetical protein
MVLPIRVSIKCELRQEVLSLLSSACQEILLNSSLRNLCVLCASAVICVKRILDRRGAGNAEVAQKALGRGDFTKDGSFGVRNEGSDLFYDVAS